MSQSALNILKKLSAACMSQGRNENVKIIKWDELPHGRYQIAKLKLSSSNFGLKLFAYLKNEPGFVILPNRCIADVNQDSEVDELNTLELDLIFGGKNKSYCNSLICDVVLRCEQTRHFNMYLIHL